MTNKTVGTTFEMELAEKLFKYGFWVHNMTPGVAGQPTDLIVVKNKKAYLIECKNCTGKYFLKSRIEENQKYSMMLWEKCGNGLGWLAVKFAENIYLIPKKYLQKDKSSFGEEWFIKYAQTLDEWLIKK